MIKKVVALSLSLLAAPGVFAASELDEVLQSFGLVDSNYEYTNNALATEFFRLVTNEYAQSLPSHLNSYIKIDSATLTPYTGRFNAIYTIPFTPLQKEAVKQELSNVETLQHLCIDYYLPNQFMVANNYNVVYSFHDENYRPIVDVRMNVLTCYDALTQ